MPQEQGKTPRTSEEWNEYHARERERLTGSGKPVRSVTLCGPVPKRLPAFATGKSYGDGVYRPGNGISG